MQGLDHDVLPKKKAPTLSKGGGSPAKAPVPEVGAKLHQGQTADMQHNVGNSGLKELLADEKHKGPAKDPARMGPDELRAQAKADAHALSEKHGPAHKKKPAGHGDSAELDEKHKAHLDAEAARKKKEADAEKAKAHDEAAHHAREKAHKPAVHAEAHGKGKPAAHVDAHEKHAAKPQEHAAKAPAHDKHAAKPEHSAHDKHGADPHVHSKKEAHVQAKKHAAHAKVVQKEAEHDHAKTKADVGRGLAGKKQKEVAHHGKAAKQKLAETGKRAAEKKVAAAHAHQKAEDAAHHVKAHVAAAPHKKPVEKEHHAEKHAKKAAGKDPKGKAATGHAAEHAKKVDPHEAKQAAHHHKIAHAETAKKHAEEKVAEHKSRKHVAEHKADHEVETAKKAAHAREAAQHAAAEKAAHDKVKKHAESVDAVQAAKEKDKAIHEVSHAGDLDAHDGEEVTLVGMYVPRPAEGGGAHLGHVSVMVGDQEVKLGQEVRGTAEILRLAGEKVVVTGKLDLKKQAGQALDPGRRDKPVLTGFRAPHRR